ncbi:protein LURP-one-related 17 [Rhodamnia argentea]|uniref:Protein LURP-one-related 17 n=1 Tax=Rhodamnia argentea TaxID=178133 RepID=A0ABM3H608_9MYRT|nr:protein LURP-one-related 17 [Rhodamnia argentea]
MFLFLKYLSRTVHEELQFEHERKRLASSIKTIPNEDRHQIGEPRRDNNAQEACVSFTVWRKSLLINCNGFTVIDSRGDIVYRVDSYGGGRPREVILMDGAGKSVLTLRRLKKLLARLDDWLVYEGEVGDGGPSYKSGKLSRKKKPICCVRKRVGVFGAASNAIAYVCHAVPGKAREYVIEGSYANRSCKVLEESSRDVVAEIKRKEANLGGGSFGTEVFVLVVRPGFNCGFAMALVLLLDQMFS